MASIKERLKNNWKNVVSLGIVVAGMDVGGCFVGNQRPSQQEIQAALAERPAAAGTPAPGWAEIPAGFCENEVPIVFGPGNISVELLQKKAPCGPGDYIVFKPWSSKIPEGETKRFSDWDAARQYASNWEGGSLWFESEVEKKEKELKVPSIESWRKFCAGRSPLIFTGGGILNAGSLESIEPPCEEGEYVVVEPWRPGCEEPTKRNPNCNVGKKFYFESWEDAVNWLEENDWPEGSFWFRPGDSPKQK